MTAMNAKISIQQTAAEMPTVEDQGIFHYSTVVNDFVEKDFLLKVTNLL
jgi:hypothetical protein